MAEDRYAPSAPAREGWLFPHLFRTFRVALDPKKLLLAAAGIVVMAVGWWALSQIFYQMWSQPSLDKYQVMSEDEYARKYPGKSKEDRDTMRLEDTESRNRGFNEDTDRWLQLHYLAGQGLAEAHYQPQNSVTRDPRRVWGGRLRTMPWFEDRGPNPYLLVTGQTERPWEKGHFVEWFLQGEVPVLIEPLVKFLEPIIHLLSPKTGTYTRVYLLLILLWTLATWALFGGMITRMATVELAGKDPVPMSEAFAFVRRRYVSYLLGPIVPLGLVAVLIVVSIVFGLLHMIPAVGEIIDGLLWPFMILLGLGMALLLVGLVGYPMMYPTISAEGSDTLDALSRSYNYVYQSPWSYIWYAIVSILYGAVVIFFVGFMGSLTVYLGKWAMAQTPGIKSLNRSPEYLFIYSPTSFGWREMLVSDSPAEEITRLTADEQARRRRGWDADRVEGAQPNRASAQAAYDRWTETFWWYRYLGAALVSFWITLLFLMVLGFGYSFFWTASSMIYLLMRYRVDDMDIDEVYLEETESADAFGGGPTTPLPTTPAAPVASVGATPLQETLTVRSDRQGTMPASQPSAATPPPPPVASTPSPVTAPSPTPASPPSPPTSPGESS